MRQGTGVPQRQGRRPPVSLSSARGHHLDAHVTTGQFKFPSCQCCSEALGHVGYGTNQLTCRTQQFRLLVKGMTTSAYQREYPIPPAFPAILKGFARETLRAQVSQPDTSTENLSVPNFSEYCVIKPAC